MTRRTAIAFATAGVICFVGTGVSLSYQKPIVALILLFAAFTVIAAGFIYKQKLK